MSLNIPARAEEYRDVIFEMCYKIRPREKIYYVWKFQRVVKEMEHYNKFLNDLKTGEHITVERCRWISPNHPLIKRILKE